MVNFEFTEWMLKQNVQHDNMYDEYITPEIHVHIRIDFEFYGVKSANQVYDLVELEAEGDPEDSVGVHDGPDTLLVSPHQVLKQALLIRDSNRGRNCYINTKGDKWGKQFNNQFSIYC